MESADSCLICGADADPTVEHIIPQTLWHSFGLDPNGTQLQRYRTRLCVAHNEATSKLHNNQPLLDLISTGKLPGHKPHKTLAHLSNWAVWVTLLMGLRTGEGVCEPSHSRELLRERFGAAGKGSNLPAGIRVYAARVDNYVTGTDFTSYQVVQDHNVVLDYAGSPSGMRISSGPSTATEAIGVGKMVLLVLPRTYSSGSEHKEGLDKAAASVGLERIYPPSVPGPNLEPKKIDMRAVSEVFLPPGRGTNLSLLPPAVRTLMAASGPVTKSL